MAGTNSNNSSYQKSDYQPVNESSEEVVENASSTGSRVKKAVIGLAGLGVVAVLLGFIFGGPSQETKAGQEVIAKQTTLQLRKDGSLQLFDDQKRYVMEDYDAKSTFASFLPAVAGYFGKPVWAFYVNRGQGISTFGTESKDTPILEFNAANKAYQSTDALGFRTFVRASRGKESFEVEPFTPQNTRNLDLPSDSSAEQLKPKRILYVGINEMEIQEIDGVHGLTTSVQYYILPEEQFASLVRRTTFTNAGDTDLTLEGVLDGVARMEPFGGALDGMLKNMGRTLEGWMGVYFPKDGDLTMPFYKLSTEPSDSASVKIEEAGHYCLGFVENDETQATLLPIIYDTDKVFGKDTTLTYPQGLYASSVKDILAKPQYGWAKTSSAFATLTDITLKPGENITLATVYGKANHMALVDKVASVVTVPGYVAQKYQRAREMMNELTASVETSTVNALFDGHVKQMFMDNGLRGGIPTILGDVDSDMTYDEDPSVKVFHTFSRIHGDLERDYNAFKIDATYFSQGPGNYRDVAQNRRNDVTFTPRMGSFDVQQFLSFIQADSYEPLTVEAVVFRYNDPAKAETIANKMANDAKSAKVLKDVMLGGPFRPGQLIELCKELNINLSTDLKTFINTMVANAEDRAMAVYGTGYWADHWDYYMDLIEAYLAIYPDGEEQLMYENQLRYFFSTATVKPRSDKYVLSMTYDGKGYHVQQLDSTYYDEEKAKEQEAFRNQNTGQIGIEASWQRTAKGVPFTSTPIAKLFLLGAIKYATRDAWGMGVEYEGGRPGWLDSMNGLPGMVGSGMPETYELAMLLEYVKKVVGKYKRPLVIPGELDQMLGVMNKALDTLLDAGIEESSLDFSEDVPKPMFEYWDVVAAARENYRNNVQYYFSGNETTLDADEVVTMVDRWLDQIKLGIARSFLVSSEGYEDDGSSGVAPTFFAYEVTKWRKNNKHSALGLPCVNALSMKVKKFPLFLEGPVRYMKTIQDDNAKMKDMYEKVFDSGLRDTKLNMYFLSASLTGQTFDMGRQIAFAPGWLENQSIWTHMSYKFYLQLLRGKLYEQFFSEMRGGGMLPFMDPDVYGRSLMECSSFVASSVFPDPSIAGKGFVARLSGSTAEFLDMWKIMFIGPRPFMLNDRDRVVMELNPTLPSWLFEDEQSGSDPTFDEDGNHVVSFKLFGTIIVTYHNPGATDLFDAHPKSYVITMNDGDKVKVDGSIIPTKTAKAIRKIKAKSIDAYF